MQQQVRATLSGSVRPRSKASGKRHDPRQFEEEHTPLSRGNGRREKKSIRCPPVEPHLTEQSDYTPEDLG